MNTNQVLNWIGNLPAVNGSNAQQILFAAKREEVVALVKQADAMSGDAAKEARNDAYRAALRIESEARRVWSDNEIISAKAGL